MDLLTKKMYVPDPKKWIDYYKNVSNGHINPYIAYGNKHQTGGALMGSTKQFMIPIENNTNVMPSHDNLPKLQLISPAEQVVQQAKDELKKGIKRNSNENIVIVTPKRRKRNTSKVRKSRKVKKVSRKALSQKRKQRQKKSRIIRQKKSKQQKPKKAKQLWKAKQVRKRKSEKNKLGSFNDIFA